MRIFRKQMYVSTIVIIVAVLAMACGVAPEQENNQLQEQAVQMGSAPTIIIQPGQLQPAPERAAQQESDWDNEESIRGGLRLLATYDSSGPDAWDVAAHPLVYFTSEGTEDANPAYDENAPYFVGFHIIDAYSKEVVASFLLEEGIMGGDNNRFPHGFVTSPDGKWGYFGWGERTPEGEDIFPVGIVNIRTLKLDKVLMTGTQPGQELTSVQTQGRFTTFRRSGIGKATLA